MKKITHIGAAAGLTIGLIVCCLFANGAVASSARRLPGDLGSNPSGGSLNSRTTNQAQYFDDFEDSPCARFPKDAVFDSFEKALRAPGKARCLIPTFEGDDLNMKHLPAGLGALVNLEVLSFGCLEQLEDLPAEIGNLRRLEELIIDNGNGCSMNVSLPGSIGKLQNLRVLRLYGAIETPVLPQSIANLRKLEVLDIARNGLRQVPPQIAALPNLKTLRLEYNSLRRIPDFVGNYKNLKELTLDSNGRMPVLPASLAKLKGLKLSMGNNSLKLRDQSALRRRFPAIVFTFEDEFDDEAANEDPVKPKSRPKRRQ